MSHKSTKHGAPKSFVCEECKKEFAAKNGLKHHMDKIHKNIRYDCDTCNKTFTGKESLRKHKLSVHLNMLKYECDQCEKTYKSSSGLYSHKESVHDTKTHQCNSCLKIFNGKNTLRVHFKRHKAKNKY